MMERAIIRAVTTHVLVTPLDRAFAFSQGEVSQRSAMIVEILTDSGAVGWGECVNHGLQPPQVVASVVNECLKPMIIGRDVFDREVLWQEMYNRTRPFGQKGAVLFGIAAIDMALWDLAGKLLHQPIYRLLGGAFRTEVTPYATGFYRVDGGDYPKDLALEAARYADAGYVAMKLKVGFGVEADLRALRAVRAAVGDGVRLMMDANCAYDVAAARRLLLKSVDSDVDLFEEPLSPENHVGYHALRGVTATRIATGENEHTGYSFRDLICSGAVDVIQPDVGAAGGITECLRIAHLAQLWHVPIMPHVWGTGIGLAAAMQFIAALPPEPLSTAATGPMLEYDQSAHPFRRELISGALDRNARGTVAVPCAPGLGVDVSREVVARYELK